MTDTAPDLPKEIAVWRFSAGKADEWIHGGWSEDHDHKTTRYIRADLATPDEWLPIESAPKDGVVILLSTEATIAAGYFEPGSTAFGIAAHWRNSCRDKLSFTPTHWKPLPAPPQAISATEGVGE